MATSFDDRMAIAGEVRDFYNTATRFADGRLVARSDRPPQPNHQQQLECACEICRDALTEVVDENCGRDSNGGLVTLV